MGAPQETETSAREEESLASIALADSLQEKFDMSSDIDALNSAIGILEHVELFILISAIQADEPHSPRR